MNYRFQFHGRTLWLDRPEFFWAGRVDGAFLGCRVWLQGDTQCMEILTREELSQLI